MPALRGTKGAEVTQRVPSPAYADAGSALVCGACAFAQQQPSVSAAADECFAPPDAQELTIELAKKQSLPDLRLAISKSLVHPRPRPAFMLAGVLA